MRNDNISDMLEEYTKKINAQIDLFFDREIDNSKLVFDDIGRILKIGKEYSQGGKRLRALLVVIGYKVCGGNDMDAILDCAHFIELTQNWFLIHDDICDDALIRRDKPAFHISMGNLFTSANKLNESLGIVVGDLMESYAVKILAGSMFGEELKGRVMKEYGEMLRKTGIGQLLDILSTRMDISEITEEYLYKIHEYKTANYTVISPLVIGGIFASADSKKLDTLRKFGYNIGIAFQLIDDIIGVGLSRDTKLRKTQNDITEGKRTLLIWYAWKNAMEREKEIIRRVLGNKNASLEDIERVREIIVRTGSLRYSEDKAENLLNDAYKIIRESNFTQENKKLLTYIGEKMVRRSY